MKHFVFKLVLSLTLLIVVGVAAVPKPVSAEEDVGITDGPGWVIVASNESIIVNEREIDAAAIYVVNTGSNIKYGPFLIDELMVYDESLDPRVPTGSQIFDVTLTPDGFTALVSDFGNGLIHFIDVSKPIPRPPVYLGSVKLDMFAEDIAISSDGKYALISDGGFTKYVYVINIAQQEVVYQMVLPRVESSVPNVFFDAYANAVAVSDNGTVIIADYFGNAVHSLLLDEDGRLTYLGSHQYYLSKTGEVIFNLTSDDFRIGPVNVAIAPDGVTVLVSNATAYYDDSLDIYDHQYSVGVYRITSPGVIEFVEVVNGLSHAMQSIVFNETGDKAYMHGNGSVTDCQFVDSVFGCTNLNDGLFVMDILGSGNVQFNDTQSTELSHYTSSQLFGVDTIAFFDQKAYLTYPTISIMLEEYPNRTLSVVDLQSFTLTDVDWGLTEEITPIGLTVRQFIPVEIYLPIISK
ncbi:MAG: hypothetical protein CL609_14195 [Anaerolineaceae bacterium]|nr:hypothetical protein [Anaerolineaceae bacterium]